MNGITDDEGREKCRPKFDNIHGYQEEDGPETKGLQAENARLVQALYEIEGQAVCVGMDGDEGNAEMLHHIVRVIESILRRIGSTAASRLADAAPDLLEACEEFVRKCECGEARSVRSYAQMKRAVAKAHEITYAHIDKTPGAYLMRVFKDGVQINDVVEVNTAEGWAVRFVKGSEPKRYKDYGNFSIKQVEETTDDPEGQ